VGLSVFHVVFPDISHIWFECGENLGILRGIPSVPHNIVMNMYNVKWQVGGTKFPATHTSRKHGKKTIIVFPLRFF
jgi:hypothetical protein